jgi:hypothetical protein
MPEYPTLEATADDVAARAYKSAVCWALHEGDRVEAHIARAMAEAAEGWYLPALRAELGYVRVFLAVLVGANSNLNGFTVAGDGWVAALRALLSEEPAPSEPVQCLHHDPMGEPAHVPGCDDDGRCPHDYFRSGAGSCPMCAE